MKPALTINDKKAKRIIFSVSALIFLLIVFLGKIHLKLDLGFDTHVFALINAVLNTCVSIVLIWALIAVKKKNIQLHKNLMLTAILLSILFLLSYVAHHLLNGDTVFGGSGTIKLIYYFILLTHIPLAGIILPFILFAAYRGLTGEYAKHKKIVRYAYPLWLYVSITGVLIYILISPYYS